MKRKYFFFDIDGTLTDRKTGIIVPSAKEAVRKLEAAGHFVAINTGRAHYKARKFFDEQGFTNMVCNSGHGIVINKKLVENSPADYDAALALYREADEKGFGVLAAMDDSEKVYTKDFRFYDQAGIRKEPTVYIIDEHFDPADYDAIYKLYISITADREDELPAAKNIGHLWFEPEYMLVQPDDKRAGLMRMLELVGGDPDEVVVFGDDVNDEDMFAPQFYKVCMGNGNPELMAMADEVAPANTDDGIYKVCEAHGWFEKVDNV